MSLLPWWCKLLALAAFGAFCAAGGFRAGYGWEKAEKEKVQAAWDQDKAARIQRTSEIVLQQVALRDKLSDDLREARSHVQVRTVTVVKEIPEALGPLADYVLPHRAVELYNLAAGTSDTPRSDPESGRTTATGPPETATVAQLETTCAENAAEQLIGVARYNALLKRIDDYNASLKGAGNGRSESTGAGSDHLAEGPDLGARP